jgi:hypothetical protein
MPPCPRQKSHTPTSKTRSDSAAADGSTGWIRKTGRILAYSDEAADALEDGDASDLPKWMNGQIEAAREILRAFGELPEEDAQSSAAGNESSVDDSSLGVDTATQEFDQDSGPDRYLRIEPIPSNEAFQFKCDFVEEVENTRACDALSRALGGNKPFRRFKDALLDFPVERDRWFEYEATRIRDYIEEWARDHGIETAS